MFVCYVCILTGYLDPKSYVIKSYDDGKEVRRPDLKERTWILENCRICELPEENATAGEVGAGVDEGKSQQP